MDWNELEESRPYRVLQNGEGQYSLWPATLRIPPGWDDVGVEGSRDECMASVDELWTDMRPRSLQRAMAADASGAPRPALTSQADA